MSTGTASETQLEYTQAHQWCIEMRAILGNSVKQKLGIGTDAKKLAQSEQKVFDRLKELHKLFPEGLPKEAREFEAEYSKMAWEGNRLKTQYLELENQIKEKKQQRDALQKKRSLGEKFRGDTSRVDDIQLEIDKLIELQEEKKQAIANKSEQFIELADSVKVKVDDRIKVKEDYVKTLQEKKIPPDVIKLINAARSEWNKQKKTAQGLVKYFNENCNVEAGKACEDAFEKCRVDIYSIYSVADAQKLLSPMADFVATWGINGKKKQYEDARKRFQIAYKTAPGLMTEVQKVSEGTELSACLEQFTRGQSVALLKNWIEADSLINNAFLERLRVAIQLGANGKGAWAKANEELVKIKSELDSIADPGFTILCLKPLGEACKLADEKNYLEAYQKFNANKAKSLGTIEVAKKVEAGRRDLADTADAIMQLIEMIPHGPMSLLANQYVAELQSIANAFWDERHVDTLDKLNALRQRYTDRLNTIKSTVQSYTSTDPQQQTQNLQLVEDLKNGRNIEATIQVIKSIIDKVSPAIRLYEAAIYSPSAPSPEEPIGTWKRQLQDAIDFHKELVDETLTDQTAIKGEYVLHSSNLDGLDKRIQEQIAQRATAINELRAKINTELDWFKTKMFVTRLDTVFKEATWHKEAKLEFEELKAMATVNNLAQLEELLPRAQKLKERCDRVLKAMPQKLLEGILDTTLNADDFASLIAPEKQSALFSGTQAQNDYNELKSRLSTIRSTLKNKEWAFYVPKSVEKVSSELSSVDSDLRSDGYPGLMDSPVLQKHRNAVDAVSASLNTLVATFNKVKKRRDEIEQKLVLFRSRITKELEPAIEKAGNIKITGEHLPIMKASVLLSLRLGTEDLDEFATIESELGMLNDDLTLLLLAADEPNGLADQIEAHKNGEAEKLQTIELMLEARLEYETTRKEFDEVWKKLKSVKDVDKKELDVIRTLKNQANDATTSKPENWKKATKDIKLALLLAERLEKDPLGSQTTDRGQKHLTELTPRWIGGIRRINETVNVGLHDAIFKSCDADKENVADAVGISRLFKATIGSRFDASSLKEDAFTSELLVMQRVAPKGKKEKEADKREKKKAREQALVKLRQYKHLVEKDPVFQDLMYKKNPWTNEGGHVDGLPLMRAINDIELNVERGIY